MKSALDGEEMVFGIPKKDTSLRLVDISLLDSNAHIYTHIKKHKTTENYVKLYARTLTKFFPPFIPQKSPKNVNDKK